MNENFSKALHQLKTAGRIMYGLGTFGNHESRMRILAELMTIECNRQDKPFTPQELLNDLERFRVECENMREHNVGKIQVIIRQHVDHTKEDSLKVQIKTLRERISELENQMDELSDQVESLEETLYEETQNLNTVRNEIDRNDPTIKVLKNTNRELSGVFIYAGELSRAIESSMKQKS